jgi:hypothetical protein
VSRLSGGIRYAEYQAEEELLVPEEELLVPTETPDEQRPVGVLNPEPDEEPTTYAGRKEAAKRRIAALLGEKVTMHKGRTESLEWRVVEESNPDNIEKANENIGLTNYGEIMGVAQPGTFLAHLFIRMMFEVSLRLIVCF